METLQFYVKDTSNYLGGMPLKSFDVLSETWTDESVQIPFGQESDFYEVVGWTDLCCGQPCPVNIVKVCIHAEDSATGRKEEGFLVYGGNSGVRILDEESDPTIGVDEHLPNGYGLPFVWVEDIDDLPKDVQEIVTP